MKYNFRPAVLLTATGLLGAVCLWQAPASAQKVEKVPQVAQRPRRAAKPAAPPLPPPGAKGGKTPDADVGEDQFAEGLNLPKDRRKRQALQAAREFIDQHDYDRAIDVLQRLLTSSKEDVFIDIKHKEKGRLITEPRSLFHEADRLLGSLPPDGMDAYELRYGGRAKALLEEAKKNGDRKLLAEVALKYHYTNAGAEAANLLGTLYLDRGDYVTADRSFDSLMQHRNAEKLSPVTLLKAALAFRRAGDTANYAKAWAILRRQIAADGLTLGDQTLSTEQVESILNQGRTAELAHADREVPMFRGVPSRCTQYVGGQPYLDDVKWSQPAIKKYDGDRESDFTESASWVQQAIESQRTSQQAVLPGFFPVAATIQTDEGAKPMLFYRSYWGIHAFDLESGQVEWYTPSDHGLQHILANNLQLSTLKGWWTQYISSGSAAVIYENSVLGTLSTDGNLVYAVDDLALPPHPNYMNNFMWGGAPSFGTFLDEARKGNQLRAYDAESGKAMWSLGSKESDKADFQESFFLGPPLPLGGKLYVLNEKRSEMRLLCLQPHNDTVDVLWSQPLANMTNGLDKDVARRMHAAHLAYGEGILVCPTNAGAVLAIDLLTHSLVWAKAYKDPPPTTNPQQKMGAVMRVYNTGALSSEWKNPVPIVQDGRVVFTAPDGSDVVCLDLRTGNEIWRSHRVDDLYLAGVYNGKVLLVGKRQCRALNLANGAQLWTRDTGLPSGQGVASNNVYYLPLQHGDQSKDPEVCRIDINTGNILGRSKARARAGSQDQPEAPGNLLFFGDDVISQTATSIRAYPQVDAKIKLITVRLQKNPDDPIGLTERGEMHLDKGQWQAAADDLHRALAHKPPATVLPKTQAKLFESLTELLNRDFSHNESSLNEYEKLCAIVVPSDATPDEKLKIQEEHKQRYATYLALVAKGRESQGRLVDALEAYRKFGSMSNNRELIPSVDDSSIQVRPDLWAQERIATMLAKATPAERKPLDGQIAKEWQQDQASGDPTRLQHFVAVFGVRSSYGQQAMLELARQRLKDPKAFVEAELMLLQLRNQAARPLAARAVAELASGMVARNLMEDAAYYYRILGHEFADVEVRNGRTGADLYNDLATDKRFWPYLDEPRQSWAGKRLKAKLTYGNFPQTTGQGFFFEPEGDVLPYFQRSRLELVNGNTLRLVDRYTGAVRFSQSLNPQNVSYLYNSAGNARLPYQVQGHMLVFNHGVMVYGVDGLTGKQLWEKNLFGLGNPVNPNQGIGTSVDKDGTIELFFNGSNFRMRLGRAGPVQPSYVCLQTRRGLIAFNPFDGKTHWTRGGITPHSRLFGDPDHVYVIQSEPNGTPGSAQAFRARDGVALKTVPDFAKAFDHRLRVLGGRVLLNEDGAAGMVVSLYDIPSGKNVWTRTFSAHAKMVSTEDPDLIGVVEPSHNGKVTVFNIHTQKDVFVTRLPTKDLDKVPDGSFHLIDDDDHYYLTVGKPPDNNFMGGGTWSALNGGIRTVPVNGRLYAYHRDTGKVDWWYDLDDQMLIVDRFNEMPILLFASRSNKLVARGGARMWQYKTSVIGIDKRTGKLLYEPREDESQMNNQNFYALNIDPKAGTIELRSYQMSLVFRVVKTPPHRSVPHVRAPAHRPQALQTALD